jgi:hypothetical protein
MPETIFRFWRRQRLAWKDAAKFSSATRWARVLAWTARSHLPGPAGKRFNLLLKAYRDTKDGWFSRRQRRRIAGFLAAKVKPDDPMPPDRPPRWDETAPLDRTTILKAPGPNGEKGALLVYGEYNWRRLVHRIEDTRRIAASYDLILIAGWSPADYASLSGLVENLDDVVFVEAGNYSEIPVLEGMHPLVRCLPTICCDWTNPALYTPRPFAEKDVDILMVANWSAYKRHWHFFSLLSRMDPKLRVTMVGQPVGPFTLDRVRQQARDFGATQDINFLQDPSNEVLRDYQTRSKVSLIFSRQEGPCVVVAESFFADTPVGMLRGAHVGTTAYINPKTGVLLSGRRADRQLTAFVESAGSFRAREWAMQNVSCHVSIAKVSALLRSHAASRGRPWTRDLVTYCWQPLPGYFDRNDWTAMVPSAEALRRDFPALVGPDSLVTAK